MQKHYNEVSVLSQCDDIILEAKRVLLNEVIDEMAEYNLSEYCNPLTIKVSSKECRHDLPWNDTEFWKDLPNPNERNYHKNTDMTICNSDINNSLLLNKINEIENKAKVLMSKKRSKRNIQILRTYFNKWHLYLMKIKETKMLKEIDTRQKEKLMLLMENSAKQKQHLQKYGLISDTNEKEDNELKRDNIVNLKPTESTRELTNHPIKNRFKAQKKIIEMQKSKLAEQEKMIEELRLGIIKEDLMKSINNTKIDLQEINRKCSIKTKCTVIPRVELEEDDREKIMIKTRKAPKIMRQMEQRAIERALKREVILNRRRLIEAEKKRIVEEAIENKRIQDEEERKRNLNAIKERRMEELRLEKMRQMNKQKFLEKFNKAVRLYTRTMLKKYCTLWKLYWLEAKANSLRSEDFFISKTLARSMKTWLQIIDEKYRVMYSTADALYNRKLLRFVFNIWKQHHREYVLSTQVADDFHDLCLQTNIFVHWRRYVFIENISVQRKMLIANNHYARWIMFHYFYQWKSLPAINRLEKAKEEKKRKWRDKVWEVIPDYKPPNDELYL